MVKVRIIVDSASVATARLSTKFSTTWSLHYPTIPSRQSFITLWNRVSKIV